MANHPKPNDSVAILVSGGADSAILCAEALTRYAHVYPIYVRFGLRWETAELAHLRAFLEAIHTPALAPLTVLDEPVAALYGSHWSTDNPAVPDAASADAAVYLPGRNLLLLAKAAVWCSLHNVATVMLGSLSGNPFPDSTPTFDRAMEQVCALGLQSTLRIERPYLNTSKSELLRRGAHLPLSLSFSCIQPVAGEHCGACNKCAERQRAFRAAGISDTTPYATHSEALCTA